MPGDRLTLAECAQLGSLASAVDCRRVRVYREDRGIAGVIRTAVLRLSQGRAIALGNHVFLPDRCRYDLPVLAHELTHCGQYQAWGTWAYFTRGAATQLRDLLHRTWRVGSSPYRYTPESSKPFSAYGMEQQGQIVEDCFRGHPAAREISPFHPGQRDDSHQADPSA
jgi:Domain of unknown function (DUF4157)